MVIKCKGGILLKLLTIRITCSFFKEIISDGKKTVSITFFTDP